VYLVAAIPALLIGLYGEEDGALFPYALVAAIITVCFFYPTLIGWSLVFAAYCVASALTIYAVLRDMIRVAAGNAPGVLSDTLNTLVVIVWIGLLLTVTLLLWMIRPWWKASRMG
jgi:hypothetical protein